MPCDSPLWIPVRDKEIPVPCGRCPPCKIRRVNEWVFRLMYEEEHNSVSSHFVTLTYNTLTVPLTRHGYMGLKKKDFQDYMKRLRKLCPTVSLKYFAVGEYGDLNMRPHFHAIVFNCPNPDYFADAWVLDGQSLGNVFVGTCTTDSIAYCLKYIDKASFRSRHKNFHKHSRDDRPPEFSLMSQGLGKGYCDNSSICSYHRADLSRNYLTKLSGHRVAMPRYYRNRIFTKDELIQQRELIEFAMLDAQQADMLAHENANKSYSYHDKKQFEREGRRHRFFKSQQKRTL